jgi:formylglycine-generating enzyme required for sulfatase activity
LTPQWLSKIQALSLCAVIICGATCFVLFAAQNPSANQSPSVGTTKKNPQDGLLYVWIPPGSFTMGCSAGDTECFPEESPAHRVTISKGFWIGQTEVTVGAYERYTGASSQDSGAAASTSPPSAGAGNTREAMPVTDIRWDEAHDYCSWAGGRLPTEAEWEYAARGGSAQARYGSLDAIAWFGNNSEGEVHQVSQKLANGYGLFDVLGNAWEWVDDWYDGNYYASSPQTDPSGPANGKMHVVRGGSWINASRLVRLTDRGRSNPDHEINYFGIRCVWTPKAP